MIKDCISTDEGFIRLTTTRAQVSLLEVLKNVVISGQRVVLEQDGEDIAAIIPSREFRQLDYLKQELLPFPYDFYEEEYDEYDRGIHCVDLEELEDEWDGILVEVTECGEFFGILPPECLAEYKFDIYHPVAILMNMKHFWVSEYLVSEKQRMSILRGSRE